MKNLISMTEFVLLNKSNYDDYSDEYGQFNYNHVVRLENYANFLKQPLTLGMFVPCDEDGNVLEVRPKYNNYSSQVQYEGDCKDFDEAKEKVLFEIEYKIGIFNKKPAIWINGRGAQIIEDFKFLTVEDVAHWNFKLTESAIKQIGL